MASPEAKRPTGKNTARSGGFNVTQIPAELQIVAPALLQLNRGIGSDHRISCEPCPTACPMVPVVPLPDCTECQATATEACFNLHCISCWTDCASHCASPCDEGDDCHIPQLCYDEHCAADGCPDDGCPDDPCDAAACPEVLHCDTTCFADSCFWPTNNNHPTTFDPQLCAQGQCYGFLSCAPGSQNLNHAHEAFHNLSEHTNDVAGTWNQPVYHVGDSTFSRDHIHTNSHHKRRKTNSAGCGQVGDDIFSDQSALSYQTLDPHLNHEFPDPTFDSQTDHDEVHVFGNHYWNPCQFDFLAPPPTPSYAETSARHTSFNSSLGDNADAIDGLICGLSHVTASSQGAENVTMEHSPFCGFANNKRKVTNSDLHSEVQKLQPSTPALTSPSNNSMSPHQQRLFSPTVTVYHLETDDKEIDLTCRWMVTSGSEAESQTICGMSFTSSKELDNHVQEEHTSKLGPQQFACQWQGCNTSFKHRGKLNRHVSGAHSRYHAYQCSHCERTFCTKEQLKNHETTHTGERRYKCRFCDHTSATKTQHNTHERTHTKEKPFACPYCSHRSGDSSNLSKHVRNKHPGLPASRQRVSKAIT